MQRLYSRVENFCFFCCLLIIDFLAMLLFLLYSGIGKRGAEELQKLSCFLVCLGGSHKGDIHAADLFHLIVIDFGEDQLFLESQGVVPSAVEGVGIDALEVADAGESEAYILSPRRVTFTPIFMP